jgi:adenosine deaminase
MGGESNLRELKSMQLEGVAHQHLLEQSERPEGPWLVDYHEFSELRDLASARLRRTIKSRSILSPEASVISSIQHLTADIFQQLQRDGVIYAEIRFAPLFHNEKGLAPEEVVEIVASAAARAGESTGIETRLILCTLRHFSEQQSLQTAQLVKRFKGTRVAALDIAGDEAGFGIDQHRAAFQFAIEHDLGRTTHAGEARGPESVWESLKHFQPSRLGHGVRSIEDADLLAHLKQQNIHLEVCPTCNVQIDIYGTYADHPIDRLYKAGVSVGVNTDARTIVNTGLTQEYERLLQVFGWGREHFLLCNLNALRAAFLPDSIKQRLELRLMEGYGRF